MSLIKEYSRFPQFKLYYNWSNPLLRVNVKNGFTNVMHPIYLILIKFDTDFTTKLFNFIHDINIIIFIILKTMDVYTRTTWICLRERRRYCSLLSHFISRFLTTLSFNTILDWSSFIFSFCSSFFFKLRHNFFLEWCQKSFKGFICKQLLYQAFKIITYYSCYWHSYFRFRISDYYHVEAGFY